MTQSLAGNAAPVSVLWRGTAVSRLVVEALAILGVLLGGTAGAPSADLSQEAPYGGAAGRWHPRNPLPTSFTLRGVTSQAGLFVAVGDAGTVVTSLDATNWLSRATGVTNDLLAIVYGGERYVAVGDGGMIRSSADAVEWQVERSPATNALRGLAFGGGRFIAVGDAGTIAISTDGSDWTGYQIGATNVFNGVAFGHDIRFSGPLTATGYSWRWERPGSSPFPRTEWIGNA